MHPLYICLYQSFFVPFVMKNKLRVEVVVIAPDTFVVGDEVAWADDVLERANLIDYHYQSIDSFSVVTYSELEKNPPRHIGAYTIVMNAPTLSSPFQDCVDEADYVAVIKLLLKVKTKTYGALCLWYVTSRVAEIALKTLSNMYPDEEFCVSEEDGKIGVEPYVYVIRSFNTECACHYNKDGPKCTDYDLMRERFVDFVHFA